MTLESLNHEIISLSSTIAAIGDGEVGNASITLDTNSIEAALKCSETISYLFPAWCKYKLEYEIFSQTEGLVVDKDMLVKSLASISDGIANVIANREMDYDFMVENERIRIITERRMSYIDSLSGEIEFSSCADWMASDPFYNVVNPDMFVDPCAEFWGETSGVSGDGCAEVSGNSESEQVSAISEERKEEIRVKWNELGDLSGVEVSVDRPEYEDFSSSYSNDYVIANRDDAVISIVQDAAVGEVTKERDHSAVWSAVSKVIRTLSSYNEGTDSERGKRHSDALRQVIMRALPIIVSEVAPNCGSVRDYTFSGSDDPVFKKLCGTFGGLISFTYVSPKRFSFKTELTIGFGKVTTVENFSLFDL